eukprot:2666649-Amphidinium_carterae.1
MMITTWPKKETYTEREEVAEALLKSRAQMGNLLSTEGQRALKRERQRALESVKRYHENLSDVPECFKADREIVLAA